MTAVDHGRAALAEARWAEACRAFEVALQSAPHDPVALDGYRLALWWLNRVPESHTAAQAAFRAYREAGIWGQAARIAAWLGREQVFLAGDSAAMAGWFARAERLLAEHDVAATDRAQVRLWQASMYAPIEELAAAAEAARLAGHAGGDAGLEALALAFGGLAAVQAGDVVAGITRLDEAMVIATTGEVPDFGAASEVFCVMLSAAEQAGDLERSERWCAAAVAYADRYACPFLSAYCRTSFGGLLIERGRWAQAARELGTAIELFSAGHRGLRVHAVLKLAGLRAAEGRYDEAEALLDGFEDQAGAAVPRALIHRHRGEAALAIATLEAAVGPAPDRGAVAALALLVDVLAQTGQTVPAAERLAQLRGLATGSPALEAQAAALALDLQRAGVPVAAPAVDVERLDAAAQPLAAARLRLAMARSLEGSDRHGAVVWARAALAGFERLGAEPDAAAARVVLRRLGAPPRSARAAAGSLSAREWEVVALLAEGCSNRQIAERLVISVKTTEHHVSRVLDKLGLRSRSQAAAWFAARSGSPPR